MMHTIKINNPEIESFLSSQYGDDAETLLNDFVKFVKLSLNDGYPSITKEEARQRVSQAIQEVQDGSATLLSQDDYDKDMKEFMKSL